MAKRGETRPWRMRFVWDNGVKDTVTYATVEQANYQAEKMQAYADLIGSTISISVERRV